MLVDDSILPSFLEFLQKQDAQNVLNFWLAAETFRLSSREEFNPHSMMQNTHKNSQTYLKVNNGSNFESGNPALRTGVLVPKNIPDSSWTQCKMFSGNSSETSNMLPSVEAFDKNNASHYLSHSDGSTGSSAYDSTSNSLNESSGNLEINSVSSVQSTFPDFSSVSIAPSSDYGHCVNSNTHCIVNSNAQSENERVDGDPSKCSLENANKNELCDDDCRNRTFQSQGKSELPIHQARERQQMSKGRVFHLVSSTPCDVFP